MVINISRYYLQCEAQMKNRVDSVLHTVDNTKNFITMLRVFIID